LEEAAEVVLEVLQVEDLAEVASVEDLVAEDSLAADQEEVGNYH
jgi:hypothetical protein